MEDVTTNYKLIKCPHCEHGDVIIQRPEGRCLRLGICGECDGHGHLVEVTWEDEDGIDWSVFKIGDMQ